MPAQELLDWKVLEDIEPWGQRRDDWRFAVLSSVVAKGAGITKADGKTQFTAADFLLDTLLEPMETAPTKQPQSTEQIESMFRMAVAANNAFWQKREKIFTTN